MPGLTVLRGPDPTVADDAFESVRFCDDYEVSTTGFDDGTVVGHTGYPSYPVRRVETDEVVVFLEGRLYDVDDVDDHLERIGARFVAGAIDTAADWLHDRDGEYLVVAYLKDRGDVYAITDPFCRLPTYYASVGEDVIVSRELKLVREVLAERGSPASFDRVAAGQYLLFGYPLGERTLFEEASLVPPGSIVHVDDGATTYRHSQYRFDGETRGDRSVERNAAALADRFATACRHRDRDGATNVVSLSGGLDSRAVAGAYVDAGVPATAATFDVADDGVSTEARVAGDVADVLGLPWRLYDASPSPARRRALLEYKQGMNYLGMAFILDFFEQLRERHDRLTYVTGDGGDKVLVDLSPSRRFPSTSALVDHVVDATGRTSLATAAELANVDPRTLRQTVADRLATYPETDPGDKYVHFLFRERGVNFLNQGEDRNRYYFWSTSPFYARPVFEYAMACPPEQKRGRDLFAAFLREFEPALLDVEYSNFGAPITSLEFRAKEFAYDVLERYPAVRSALVDLVTDDERDGAEAVTALRDDLSNGDVAPLSEAAVRTAVGRSQSTDLGVLNVLQTLTALARDLNATGDRGGADAGRDSGPTRVSESTGPTN